MTPDELEQQAKKLKDDGYTGPVVAKKMTTEFGMAEPDAIALVSRVFGKPVNPRAGDTTHAIFVGLGHFVLVGVVLILLFGIEHRPGYIPRFTLLIPAVAVAGNGLRIIVMALVRANAGAVQP